MKNYLRFCIVACALTWPGMAGAADIVVNARRAEPVEGGAIFFLYNESNYLDDPLQELYSELDETGTATITFTNVAPGQYAVVVVHDKNGNRKMDNNFLGIPKEKGGFSNNAPAKMGPAKFDKAAFDVNDTTVTQTIYLSKKP